MGRSGERGPGISMLAVGHDGDDDQLLTSKFCLDHIFRMSQCWQGLEYDDRIL